MNTDQATWFDLLTRRAALGGMLAALLPALTGAKKKRRRKKICPTRRHIKYGGYCKLRSEMKSACRSWIYLTVFCPQCSFSSSPFCEFCEAQAASYGFCCDSVLAVRKISINQFKSRVVNCICNASPERCEEITG